MAYKIDGRYIIEVYESRDGFSYAVTDLVKKQEIRSGEYTNPKFDKFDVIADLMTECCGGVCKTIEVIDKHWRDKLSKKNGLFLVRG